MKNKQKRLKSKEDEEQIDAITNQNKSLVALINKDYYEGYYENIYKEIFEKLFK